MVTCSTVSAVCDCEHHTHDPNGTRGRADGPGHPTVPVTSGAPTSSTEHEFGAGEAVAAIKSPWGGTFHLCRACLEAGHMHGMQFR
jgi:hypothetical protein